MPSGLVVPAKILRFTGPADQDADAPPGSIAGGILDRDVENVRSGPQVEGSRVVVHGHGAPSVVPRSKLVPGQVEQPVRERRRPQSAVAVIVDEPRLGILLEAE